VYQAIRPSFVLIQTQAPGVDGKTEHGLGSGVVVDDRGMLEAIVARHHWWTGRSRFAAADLDLSYPGEVRVRAAATQAA
jgi:hypothetical protein